MKLRTLAVAVAAATLLLTGCSNPNNVDPEGGSGTPWTFEDGRGETVSLEAAPTRIVAQANAAAALLEMGIRPVAIFGSSSLESDPALQGFDLTGIESVGEVYAELDLPAILSLEPDLIVAGWYPLESLPAKGYLGGLYGADDTVEKLQDMAPIVGIETASSAVATLEDYEALATAWGAEPSADFTAAKEDYLAAAAELRDAFASKPDLTLLPVEFLSSGFRVAETSLIADTADLVELGAQFVQPEGPIVENWEDLNYESTDAYQADVVFLSQRSDALTADGVLENHPTASNIKAITAGAIIPWYLDDYNTYARYAEHLRTITQGVLDADEDLVP